MKAQFIGADGSMGLTKGAIYHISIKNEVKNGAIIVEGFHNPKDIFSDIPLRGFLCPYDNMNGFLKNWKPCCFENINGSFVYDK